jgi:hypothetical protein
MPSLSKAVAMGAAASSVVAMYLLFRKKWRSIPVYKTLSFVAWQEANTGQQDGILVVDCTHDQFPCLTHHRMSDGKKIGRIRGDTSTEIVLNALKEKHGCFRRMTRVTVNHFDVDAFLSVWALANPELALKHFDAICECACIGDFRELGTISKVSKCIFTRL